MNFLIVLCLVGGAMAGRGLAKQLNLPEWLQWLGGVIGGIGGWLIGQSVVPLFFGP